MVMTRIGSIMAGTSGWGWLCLDNHLHSTLDIFFGKVARDEELKDWCQVQCQMSNFMKETIKYAVCLSLGIISPVASEDVRQKHCTAIGQYFYHNHRRNGIYGVRFIICEFINIANAILQIYLIDSLLGGEFSSYGFKVMKYF